ncbi:MAG: hypothetical protein MJ099_05980 [Clostridia bacterium]|nr:hypothetical protein [Clostridia bacterium]
MDDFLEQYAVRKNRGLFTFLYVIIWILIIFLALMAVINLQSILQMDPVTGGVRFDFVILIMTIVFGGLAFLLWRRSDYCRIEYDYSFTNGLFEVAMVLNNRRRRYLTAFELKDVIRCGPTQGPAFQKTLAEPGLQKHNWFLNRDCNLYYFYFVKNNNKHMAVVELSDEMIAMMRSKPTYIPMTAWTGETGKSGYGVL